MMTAMPAVESAAFNPSVNAREPLDIAPYRSYSEPTLAVKFSHSGIYAAFSESGVVSVDSKTPLAEPVPAVGRVHAASFKYDFEL
jgi:hypothetical protein